MSWHLKTPLNSILQARVLGHALCRTIHETTIYNRVPSFHGSIIKSTSTTTPHNSSAQQKISNVTDFANHSTRVLVYGHYLAENPREPIELKLPELLKYTSGKITIQCINLPKPFFLGIWISLLFLSNVILPSKS